MSERVIFSDVLGAGLGADRTLVLSSGANIEVGIWEMMPGTERDTEVDEIFVILAGRGTVMFEDGEVVDLHPGVAVRLRTGERTTWTVAATLRKLYVAGI
jgi:uncharacterized protein